MSHDVPPPSSPPPPLRESAGDPLLRNLLRAAATDRPTDAELAIVAAKLGPLVGGPGGAPPASPAGGSAPGASAGAAKAGLSGIKLAAIGAASIAVVAGGVIATRSSAPPPSPVVSVAPPVVTPSVSAPADRESPAPLASVSVAAPPASAAPPSVPVRPRASDTAPFDDPDAEVKLLQRAQDALRSRPAEALALADSHARRAPRGLLAEEREVIAIDALVRLGRTTEARSRAARFRSTWPGSSHLTRVDSLIGAAK